MTYLKFIEKNKETIMNYFNKDKQKYSYEEIIALLTTLETNKEQCLRCKGIINSPKYKLRTKENLYLCEDCYHWLIIQIEHTERIYLLTDYLEDIKSDFKWT